MGVHRGHLLVNTPSLEELVFRREHSHPGISAQAFVCGIPLEPFPSRTLGLKALDLARPKLVK